MLIRHTLPHLLQILPNPDFDVSRGAPETIPSEPGIYLLLIGLEAPVQLVRPQPVTLDAGLYGYAGSARGPGGLAARVGRHFKRQKKQRWHIDQITLQASDLRALGWARGNECQLIACLQSLSRTHHPIARFGSTDCPRCTSHLLALG